MESKLIARLCIVFVDNLTLMMRTALVVGAIFLVQDLRLVTEKYRQLLVEVEPVLAVHAVEAEPIAVPQPEEPVVTERVLHFLNCTYEDYRTLHYDECVEGHSSVYLRPLADDDTGYVRRDVHVLLARLDDHIDRAVSK